MSQVGDDGMTPQMRANVEADNRFYRSKISPQEVMLLDALQGKGEFRRSVSMRENPFALRKPQEVVEVVRWTWKPGHVKAHDYKNVSYLLYEEVWEQGYRDWGLWGDITIVNTPEELRQLFANNPHTYSEVRLVTRAQAQVLTIPRG